jgi:polyisoprenoid-binding protein YceI
MSTTIPAPAAPALATGTWDIDPAHSEVGFTARHLMTKVRGLFTAFEGTLRIPADGSRPSVQVAVDLDSIDTRNSDRDTHLRSGDFFDVASHGGQMTFESTAFLLDPDGTFTLTGNLTIRGVTRLVTLVGDYLGTDTDPWGGTRIGFDATTTISRSDFGLDFNIPLDGGRLLVGDKVDITLTVQAVQQPATGN